MRLTIPDPALVLLIGPAGAGKSTFALANFKPTEIVSSDAIRATLTDDAGDQEASNEAFRILALVLSGRLKRHLTTVVDATNLRAQNRRAYVSQARRHEVPTVAIAFDLPLDAYHAWNQQRHDRIVGRDVVEDQAALMAQTLSDLDQEGHVHVFVVRENDLRGGIEVVRSGLS